MSRPPCGYPWVDPHTLDAHRCARPPEPEHRHECQCGVRL